MKGLCILGSTGSIGVSSLDVIRLNKKAYQVVALTANNNVDRLFEQCLEFQPDYAVLLDQAKSTALALKLKGTIASKTQVLCGVDSLEFVTQLPQVDIVIAAIVGAAGLLPTLAGCQAGKRVLLANKEALVMSGDLLMQAVRENGAELLPLDSEHNAIFQCMPAAYRSGQKAAGVRKIILTASGGPFLGKAQSELRQVSPEQACKHPNWSMGRKISVDSATLMNKGLEVIEASFLFNLPVDDIEVIIHPQSIIHSMVDYVDGSVLAQMGNPDMRTPIAHALAWPKRHRSGVSPLDLILTKELTFDKPNLASFPCLKLAFEALKLAGTAPTILNAANEVAVEAFLSGKIGFMGIAATVAEGLSRQSTQAVNSISCVLSADKEARAIAQEYIKEQYR